MMLMDDVSMTAYVALGANLGDREGNIGAAIVALRGSEGIQVVRVSKLIENPAVGGPVDSPEFLNGVAEIKTTLPPRRLLDRLLEIERELGRERREKWSPRRIDLDLLLYGDQVIETESLVIPHPLMHTRQFVLKPLAEIAPDLVHPTLKATMKELWINISLE
jgi:2-amino-4-hydroxy-6-hydroxymethyldihydropteridine diphosphokinase